MGLFILLALTGFANNVGKYLICMEGNNHTYTFMLAGRDGLQSSPRHLWAAEAEGKRLGRFFLDQWLNASFKNIKIHFLSNSSMTTA